MINEITVEGLVIRTWSVIGDNFYRLACYRDPGLPPRPRGTLQDTAELIALNVPDGALGRPRCVMRDDAIQVLAFLQCGYIEETLAVFTRGARSPALKLLDGYDPRRLVRTQSAYEILASRIVRAERKPRPSTGARCSGHAKPD